MTQIIGLLGPAGSGKSTVANYLETVYGARRYSFAKPLKEIARWTLDFTDEQLYGTQEQKETIDPRYGFSPRWFLQKLGTNGCRRVLGDDFWVSACFRIIARDKPELAVIEDVRFLNEVKEIHYNAGGEVIRLNPPIDEESMARARGAGLHESEREWSIAPVSFEFHPKTRGIAELHAFVDKVADVLGPWRKR